MKLRILTAEIQELATAPGCDVASLMLKCKLAASQITLQNQPEGISWEAWIRHECDGYPQDTDVPDYRILSYSAIYGDFGDAGMRDIPFNKVAPAHKKIIDNHPHRSPISDVARNATIQDGKNPGVSLKFWAPLFAIDYGMGKVQCTCVYGIYDRERFVRILESVRNKVVEYALTLEKEASSTNTKKDSPDSNARGLDNARIVNNYFYGNTIIGANNNAVINVSGVIEGDFNSLRKRLIQDGVAADDIEDLRLKLKDAPTIKGKNIPKVIYECISRIANKTWQGAGEIAVNRGLEFIVKAVERYSTTS